MKCIGLGITYLRGWQIALLAWVFNTGISHQQLVQFTPAFETSSQLCPGTPGTPYPGQRQAAPPSRSFGSTDAIRMRPKALGENRGKHWAWPNLPLRIPEQLTNLFGHADWLCFHV